MYPGTPVVAMDTVKSARGCTKALLTLIFPESNFMLVFLITRATQKCVLSIFDYLTRLLGVDTFHKLFPVILTDNGVEFKDPNVLEFPENGCRRTNIFYCDPMASWQKPHVEKNQSKEQQKLLELLNLSPVPPDEVMLSPALFKH